MLSSSGTNHIKAEIRMIHLCLQNIWCRQHQQQADHNPISTELKHPERFHRIFLQQLKPKGKLCGPSVVFLYGQSWWRRHLTVEMWTNPHVTYMTSWGFPTIHNQAAVSPTVAAFRHFYKNENCEVQLPKPVCHKLSGIGSWHFPFSTYRWETQGASQVTAECKLAFRHRPGSCL